jgi:hypothetical protein
MTGWRQAVFLRQRRLDVIQRALAEILDEEAWSAATPRRLYIGGTDASSRGWTMIVPQLADFFLDPGGRPEPRLARLARALRCPGYEVDLRDPDALALYEVDERGRMRGSGARRPWIAGAEDAASPVSFGLVPVPDEISDRVAAAAAGGASALALADYLGAFAGFPAWTRWADAPVTPGELVYEPPRIIAGARLAAAAATARPPETRAASGHRPLRDAQATHDRRGRRPRSASRPRR